MKKYVKLNENRSLSFMQHNDFMRGLPFYGTKGDFNFVLGRSQFTPGVSVKIATLTDMSVKGDPGLTEFDRKVSLIKSYFKPGDRIRGILVNSFLNSNEGKAVTGKIHKIENDYKNGEIRIYIKDPRTLKVNEVYVDSIERIYESIKLKRLGDYLKS